MATRARETSAFGTTERVIGSTAVGAAGGGLLGTLGGAVVGFLTGALTMALPALLIGAAGAGIGAVIGFIPAVGGPAIGAAWVGGLAAGATALFGAIPGMLTGGAIGAGAGAGLFGAKSAMGTMDKIQSQAQQYDLQKGAGKQMVQSAYVKGRIDGKQEGVFLGYQAGAGESMQVAQGHLADAYNHGVADMAQAVAQKFEGQARSKSEPPEMPQAEMPQASAEAPEGTSHSACCNRKSLKPNDLKGGISPEAIKDQQLNGASAEIGPR